MEGTKEFSFGKLCLFNSNLVRTRISTSLTLYIYCTCVSLREVPQECIYSSVTTIMKNKSGIKLECVVDNVRLLRMRICNLSPKEVPQRR